MITRYLKKKKDLSSAPIRDEGLLPSMIFRWFSMKFRNDAQEYYIFKWNEEFNYSLRI